MDVDVGHPHHHHRHTGHHWFDFAIPVAALVVSLVSIFIAFHHGKVMQELVQQNERLVAANSLPYLQLYGSNIDAEGSRRISFVVSNAGIGPADIRTVEVKVDGRPVPDLLSLLRACCGIRDSSGITTSSLANLMVRPGQDVRYIDVPAGPQSAALADRLDTARQAGRIVTSVCYCSVFSECWLRTSGGERPRAVHACPVVSVPYEQ